MKRLTAAVAILLTGGTAPTFAKEHPQIVPAPRVCPMHNEIIVRTTPGCGAKHFGLFGKGEFMVVYQATNQTCVRREIFLRCVRT